MFNLFGRKPHLTAESIAENIRSNRTLVSGGINNHNNFSSVQYYEVDKFPKELPYFVLPQHVIGRIVLVDSIEPAVSLANLFTTDDGLGISSIFFEFIFSISHITAPGFGGVNYQHLMSELREEVCHRVPGLTIERNNVDNYHENKSHFLQLRIPTSEFQSKRVAHNIGGWSWAVATVAQKLTYPYKHQLTQYKNRVDAKYVAYTTRD